VEGEANEGPNLWPEEGFSLKSRRSMKSDITEGGHGITAVKGKLNK